jgi:hypothetical protein
VLFTLMKIVTNWRARRDAMKANDSAAEPLETKAEQQPGSEPASDAQASVNKDEA